MEFNTPVTDKELMASLEDGTRVDDRIAGERFRYTLVDERTLRESMQESHRKAGYANPTPIARYDPDSGRGIESGRTPETDFLTTVRSHTSSSAVESAGSNRTKRVVLWAGIKILVMCVALAYVFIFKPYCQKNGNT